MSANNRAAAYCRSSKDRGDVSIDAQRRELQSLAASKGLVVAAEFSDAVESANDVNRPGFRDLLLALRNPARGWSTLLVLDPSRLARNVYLAESFKHECRKRGVRVLFAKVPEVNPMVDLVVVQVLQAFDQLHSMMSREKGLAGMQENVRQGWRAGGRAPLGYHLESVETGAMREGAPVRKSRLVPAEDARRIAAYLRGRAIGKAARPLAKDLGLELPQSTLHGIEWNALTYAGHTVWGMTAGRTTHGGYEGGQKRKPRSEWVIQRATHEALITEEEAEAILKRLEGRQGKRESTKGYLLAGLLVAPDGRPWHGNAGFYRAGTVNVSAPALEQAIVAKLTTDLTSEAFARHIVEKAHAAQQPKHLQAELATLQDRIGRLNQQIARVSNLIPETTAVRSLLAKLEELERERDGLAAKAAGLKAELDSARVIQMVRPDEVRDFLRTLGDSIAGFEPDRLRDFLRGIIGKITLSKAPDGAVSACIDYEIPVDTGVSVASPREAAQTPVVQARRIIRLERRQRLAA